MVIQINGSPVQIRAGTLRITDVVDQRATCSFTVTDIAGSSHYRKGMAVQITDGAAVYGGVVNDATESHISNLSSGLFHDVNCVDYKYYATKRVAAESYIDTAADVIFDDLITKYLSDEGITPGLVESAPSIHSTIINYAYLSDAFDELAQMANFVWGILPDKTAEFHEQFSKPAPFDADNSIARYGSVSVKHGNDQYRNRQYIRGGINTTDPQTESRTGDAQTTSWSMGYPLAKVPTITVDGVSKTVGIKGVDSGKDFYWSKGDNTITQDASATPLAKGSVLSVTYQGQYNVIVLSEDPGAIADRKTVEGGGTGYVDDIQDQPNTADSQSGFQTAAALLKQYATVGRTLKYRTRSAGLRSGMVQTATFPQHGLDGVQMLIQEVDTSDDGTILWYDVTAVESPVQSAWKSLSKGLARPTVWVDKVNVGEQQTLSVLAPISEIWIWTETTGATLFACPLPSTTLYPSDTLIPC